MWSVVPVLVFALAGWAARSALSARSTESNAGPLEKATQAAVLGLALWVATCWLLALTHLFTLAGVLTIYAVTLGGSTFALFRLRRAAEATPRTSGVAIALLFLAVLIAWLGYVVARAQLMPVGGNDALSYHLPRAVFFLRNHGFGYFGAGDPRVASWPANYELLLASSLLLDGGDRGATLLSVLSFVLFVLASGAVVERWTEPNRSVLPVVAAMALAASTPVALLHSGAVKNDLLANFFFLAAFVSFAQLWIRPSRLAGVVFLSSVGLALGTKLNAAMLVAAVLLVSLIQLARGRRVACRELSLPRWGGLAVVTGLATGAVIYVINLVRLGRAVGIPPVAAGGYGDWNNLWQFPYLLFTAPFSRTADSVWAPWTGSLWFWQRYDPFSSQLGPLATAMLVLLPVGYALLRRGTHPASAERVLGSAAAALTFFLILPTVLHPVGFFCTFTRFIVFCVPVLSAWTVSPALRFLAAQANWKRHFAVAITLGLVATLGVQALLCARHDLYQPASAVESCAQGGKCEIRFGRNRACVALNQVAGERDSVLMDTDYDGWSYPCFGPSLARPLVLLPELREGPVEVPPQTQWVVIDRMWNITWGHPGFTDFGHFFDYVGKGSPSVADRALFAQLASDSRFQLVFHDRKQNQAIFRRISR